METISTSQNTETFDNNIVEFDKMPPELQYEFLEDMYNAEDQERKEELPFRADTVLKVGGVALEQVIDEAERVEDDDRDKEEKKEKDIDFDEYLAQAQDIIRRLYLGDESALGALPPDFQEALKQRMEYRKKQLEDGSITEGYMQEELDKMCSVASIGLAMKRNPESF